MYRFFVNENQIGDENITIEGSDVNHIKNVLRMKQGETILVSDGHDNEYVCEIAEISDIVTAKIVDMNKQSRELPIKVTLFQALPKSDKMETVVQKMIELGAVEIVPVKTSRCIVKLDDKKSTKKVARWNEIAKSAAKQSKRGIIPTVSDVMTYEQALEKAKEMDTILFPYEGAEDIDHTREIFGKIDKGASIAIFIGPEGGFSVEEVKKAKDASAQEITLGNRILRTETAGMMIMSVLMYLFEE